MTNRERILAVVEGRTPDRVPWIPRLQLWYNFHLSEGTLPARYQGKSLREIEKELGMGTPAKDGKAFEIEMPTVEVIESVAGNTLTRTFITPRGQVWERFRIDPRCRRSGITDARMEYLIKEPADYERVRYIIEHTRYVPAFDKFLDYDREIGQDGLPSIAAGRDPMVQIMLDYLGCERFYYELNDNPRQVEALYQTLWDKQMELLELVAGSPAKLIFVGAHYDSQMTPPPLFEKYILPYLEVASDILHRHQKTVVVHQDADAKLLLNALKDSGIDMVECFCSSPMVSCTLEEAVDCWGEDMIIWGGIPSILLCPLNCSEQEFLQYLDGLWEIVQRGRFILGVADNVMPEADITRVERISEMVQYWRY